VETIPVTNENEQMFWNYVNRDQLNYFFFIIDWTQRREKTKIWLAIDGKEVSGSLLVFDNFIVQLRGSREAVQHLVECVEFDKVDLQAPVDCEDIVCRKFKPRVSEHMMLMRLNRGEERLRIVDTPTRLDVEYAEEVASLLRRCNPERWSEVTSERLRQEWQKNYWLGIMRENKLASIGDVHFDVAFATNISIIATDEHYRGKGYATSIVSVFVQEILHRSPAALIHVIADNIPAVRAYTSVGFKPYKTYLSVRT
jgi:GNAT superfamily N-acetyltransferase